MGNTCCCPSSQAHGVELFPAAEPHHVELKQQAEPPAAHADASGVFSASRVLYAVREPARSWGGGTDDPPTPLGLRGLSNGVQQG